ncbi:cytochrome P450 [Micrococcus sp. TA1]|uniref:cytochrome P450 n=1 Tax=Micrococcus sp. TA1 TaxID=681627 RepID=UPI00161B5F3B|nr:cytochrome P450 [Micrococcus sp. TA1]MBB5750327.1 cytochrome P450/NADPH-dependent glutamate synthase beta subunit-like oxidoreductase/flavodoxin [Micrococcus sp. TA1]
MTDAVAPFPAPTAQERPTPEAPGAPAGSRPAPVADWVTIPELYEDPFPVFERLRAEGGVHWVPAVGRYLVTSYDAVHDTELDQSTFSANEQGSLMIRAMGHSMLRKDDPDHVVERRAWQPVLRPSVVKRAWRPVFERNADRYLTELREKGPGADLVWDFAAPFAAENLRAITGLHNVTQQDLQRWSQTMIDATGNYADDPVVWARGEASFDEVDAALDEMLDWHRAHPDDSLLSALVALPDYQMPVESIRANLKMTIGGGLNEPRDAIGVAAWALLRDPEQRRLVEADPTLWDAVFDEAIRWVAPIGMYSRQTTRDVALRGVHLPAGAKLGICLLSANRDESQWTDPARFDIRRTGEGAHLAFGKGVHVCLGAWVARAEVADVALPRLFEALPGLDLIPDRPARAGGWVFRGMDEMPVTWTASPGCTGDGADRTAATGPAPGTTPAPAAALGGAVGPHVAVVGSGPAGCYTAQAVRRRLPEARVTVFEARPEPFGLVRYGVAPDHQGTKAVADQFSRLFEHDGVRFVGSTRVHTGAAAEDLVLRGRPAQHAPAVRSQDAAGAEVTLGQLREHFDAVVLATGLRRDAPLQVLGADLTGVIGSGELTRLLNGEPETCSGTGWAEPDAASLGRSAAVIGMGNVAMDVVRLLAKTAAGLEGSDIHDAAHATLTRRLDTVHVIGRSLPARARFDPVMLREILDLPGLVHTVHGPDADRLAAAGDPRSGLMAGLAAAGREQTGPARLHVHWWLGYAPREVVRDATGAVTGVEAASCDRPGDAPGGAPGDEPDRVRIAADSVITAIGFQAGDGELTAALDGITDQARQSGRVEPGLYLAGWARRGPQGTIPSQRSDARDLAEVIAGDLAAARDAEAAPEEGPGSGPGSGDTGSGGVSSGGAGDQHSGKTGIVGLRPYLGRATDYEGWLRLDAHERAAAAKGRVRAKLLDRRRMRLIASSATAGSLAGPAGVGTGVRTGAEARGAGASAGAQAQTGRTDLPPLTILFATESGNAELVAEELSGHLADRYAVEVLDLAGADPAAPGTLDPTRPYLLVCSTYGDGELPTSARAFHAGLLAARPGLTGLRFAVFGLGDRSYHATYSRGSEILDEALRACGAERVGEYGRHDAAGRDLAADLARPWADAVTEALTTTAVAS